MLIPSWYFYDLCYSRILVGSCCTFVQNKTPISSLHLVKLCDERYKCSCVCFWLGLYIHVNMFRVYPGRWQTISVSSRFLSILTVSGLFFKLQHLYLMLCSDYASPGFAIFHYMAPGTDWRFFHFGDFLPIWRFWQLFGDFFAHFDPWAICDNSLQ